MYLTHFKCLCAAHRSFSHFHQHHLFSHFSHFSHFHQHHLFAAGGLPFSFPMIIYLPPVHLFHPSHLSRQCSKTSDIFGFKICHPMEYFWTCHILKKMQRLGAAFWRAAVSLRPPGVVLPATLLVQVVILFTRTLFLVHLVILYRNPFNNIIEGFKTSHKLGFWVSAWLFVVVNLSSSATTFLKVRESSSS